MSSRLFAALIPLSFAACVHVNMPEHMISDTVEAGKDLVHTIAGKGPAIDELKQNGSKYSLAQLGGAETTVAELKRSCLENLVNRTKSKLIVDQLDYTVTGQSIDSRDQGLVVKCEIAVKG